MKPTQKIYKPIKLFNLMGQKKLRFIPVCIFLSIFLSLAFVSASSFQDFFKSLGLGKASSDNCMDTFGNYCKSFCRGDDYQVPGDCSGVDPDFVCCSNKDLDDIPEVNKPMCLNERTICKVPRYLSDSGYFYCNLQDQVDCVRHWDDGRDMWIGGCLNGQCADAEKPVDIPDCSEGYMECRGKKIYECIGGKWKFQEDCGSNRCIEDSYRHSYCSFKKYYCLKKGGIDCFWSDKKDSHCYDTLDECLNSRFYCCKNSETGGFTFREGSCLSGEYPYQSSDMSIEQCKRWDEHCRFFDIDCHLSKFWDNYKWYILVPLILLFLLVIYWFFRPVFIILGGIIR